MGRSESVSRYAEAVRFAWLAVLGAGACGCGRLAFDPSVDARGVDAVPADVALGAWSDPTVVAITGSPYDDPSMTADGLVLYMNQGAAVLASTRGSTADAWSAPAPVIGLPSTFYSPHISADGLTLWGTIQGATFDVGVATRADRLSPWAMTMTIAEVSSAASDDDGPSVTNDQLTLLLDSRRDGPLQIYESSRTSVIQPWSPAVPVNEINSIGGGGRPHMTDDRLAIYFEANNDIWIATRASANAPFDPPHVVPELSSAMSEQGPWVSADQRHVMFGSNRGGTFQIWEAFR
jgi:hypothetical protein